MIKIIYIPDGEEENKALSRTTHLCIAAHEDDIEFMAFSPIAECFQKSDKWFCGVVTTDGAGSPRNGIYADYTDEDMKAIRVEEQKKAAHTGGYGALAVQAHPFREDSFIDHIRLYPNVEGVEVFNAERTEKCNELGRCYAEICKKVKAAGSDLHHVSQKTLGGMIFEEKIAPEQQFVKLIREGKGKIFQTVNVYENNKM